ncbi:MerC domain-containing protein [Porphyrobacter sp. HT-58-2]|uniref:MerC domain-containing protein n=1 Tax=Porphyrobacter sp. HT-58-2 TaxID=2023229 RepID=UPI000CF38B54|nr:MerC domain-containing protein [Porphyrobacter sp. HT-58-2]
MAISLSATCNEPLWHRFGMGLSVLCLVHCLALPWLLASLPAVALAALPETLRDNEWLHAALIAPVLLVSGPVLLRARPGLLRTALVLTAFAALTGALFLESELGEQTLTVAGAALLMAAHWERLRQAHPH